MTNEPTPPGELAQIYEALSKGEATDEQVRRAQELLDLNNAATAIWLVLKAAEMQLSEHCMSDDGRDTDAHDALNNLRMAIAVATEINGEE
jgi:hypothetical protein